MWDTEFCTMCVKVIQVCTRNSQSEHSTPSLLVLWTQPFSSESSVELQNVLGKAFTRKPNMIPLSLTCPPYTTKPPSGLSPHRDTALLLQSLPGPIACVTDIVYLLYLTHSPFSRSPAGDTQAPLCDYFATRAVRVQGLSSNPFSPCQPARPQTGNSIDGLLIRLLGMQWSRVHLSACAQHKEVWRAADLLEGEKRPFRKQGCTYITQPSIRERLYLLVWPCEEDAVDNSNEGSWIIHATSETHPRKAFYK